MNVYAPCPNCAHDSAIPVKFTWWGGLLGPKLLNHVSCPHCGTKYNGATGASNTTRIVLYTVTFSIVGCLGGVMLYFLSR
jgi:hypothetical protein